VASATDASQDASRPTREEPESSLDSILEYTSYDSLARVPLASAGNHETCGGAQNTLTETFRAERHSGPLNSGTHCQHDLHEGPIDGIPDLSSTGIEHANDEHLHSDLDSPVVSATKPPHDGDANDQHMNSLLDFPLDPTCRVPSTSVSLTTEDEHDKIHENGVTHMNSFRASGKPQDNIVTSSGLKCPLNMHASSFLTSVPLAVNQNIERVSRGDLISTYKMEDPRSEEMAACSDSIAAHSTCRSDASHDDHHDDEEYRDVFAGIPEGAEHAEIGERQDGDLASKLASATLPPHDEVDPEGTNMST
jgi:hypothetical protein